MTDFDSMDTPKLPDPPDCGFCNSFNKRNNLESTVRMHCGICDGCLVSDYKNLEKYDRHLLNSTGVAMESNLAVNRHMKSFGSFQFICCKCTPTKNTSSKNIEEIITAKFEELRFDMKTSINGLKSDIEFMNKDITAVKTSTIANHSKLITELQSAVSDLKSNTATLSPPRRRKRALSGGSVALPIPTYAATIQSCMVSATPAVSKSSAPVVTKERIFDHSKPADNVHSKAKLVLHSESYDENTLKKILMQNVKENFETKVLKDRVNLLFKSFNGALEAKKELEMNIENLKLGKPVIENMNKVDLVGIPYQVSKEIAAQNLVRENPRYGFIIMDDDNCSVYSKCNPNLYLTVIDVVKCKNSNFFRVLTRMSNELVTMTDDFPLKLLTAVTHKYVLPKKRQCFNCQSYGHIAAKCTSVTVCGKCASTEHSTGDCTSKIFKCINCINCAQPNFDHPAYSRICPSYCAT